MDGRGLWVREDGRAKGAAKVVVSGKTVVVGGQWASCWRQGSGNEGRDVGVVGNFERAEIGNFAEWDHYGGTREGLGGRGGLSSVVKWMY